MSNDHTEALEDRSLIRLPEPSQIGVSACRDKSDLGSTNSTRYRHGSAASGGQIDSFSAQDRREFHLRPGLNRIEIAAIRGETLRHLAFSKVWLLVGGSNSVTEPELTHD